MRALLDVSFLLAAFDANHVSHRVARRWLESNIQDGWSSCALTQNGFVRIISQPKYPNRLAPEVAIEKLARACSSPHHTFRPCDLSVTDDNTQKGESGNPVKTLRMRYNAWKKAGSPKTAPPPPSLYKGQ